MIAGTCKQAELAFERSITERLRAELGKATEALAAQKRRADQVGPNTPFKWRLSVRRVCFLYRIDPASTLTLIISLYACPDLYSVAGVSIPTLSAHVGRIEAVVLCL